MYMYTKASSHASKTLVKHTFFSNQSEREREREREKERERGKRERETNKERAEGGRKSYTQAHKISILCGSYFISHPVLLKPDELP